MYYISIQKGIFLNKLSLLAFFPSDFEPFFHHFISSRAFCATITEYYLVADIQYNSIKYYFQTTEITVQSTYYIAGAR